MTKQLAKNAFNSLQRPESQNYELIKIILNKLLFSYIRIIILTHSWPMSSVIINAAYEPSQNTISNYLNFLNYSKFFKLIYNSY